MQIEDLKGQLNANELLLKNKEFMLNKKAEDYEFQLRKSGDENNQLKEKYER